MACRGTALLFFFRKIDEIKEKIRVTRTHETGKFVLMLWHTVYGQTSEKTGELRIYTWSRRLGQTRTECTELWSYFLCVCSVGTNVPSFLPHRCQCDMYELWLVINCPSDLVICRLYYERVCCWTFWTASINTALGPTANKSVLVGSLPRHCDTVQGESCLITQSSQH
jgi:hypothetical protein